MILEAIYNGNFYPSEAVVPKSEKYRNALKACEKIMDRLAEKLSKEDYDLVEERKRLTKQRTCQTRSPSERIIPCNGRVILRAVSKIHGHSEKIH